MKKIIILLSLLTSLSILATVDGNHSVYILSKDINSEEYFVQKAPIIGCWGLAKGPELLQLTREYVVNNLGCGMETKEDINALSCATLVDSEESFDFTSFSKVVLDISKCEDRNNEDFIKNIKKVVNLNFKTKTVKSINLEILK